MKLTSRDKRALQLLTIFAIIAVSGYNIFYVKNGKFSLQSINNKQTDLIDLNNQIESNNRILQNTISEYDSLKETSKINFSEVENMKNKIKDEYLKLHIPSALVFLEQHAQKNNLDIIIDFNNIETIKNINNNMIPEIESEMEEIEGQETVDGTDEIPQVVQSSESDTEIIIRHKNVNNYSEIIDDLRNTTYKSVNFLNVTIVPLKMKGNYTDFIEFIKDLEEVNYMEPCYINFVAEDGVIDGDILISIFHEEGE